MPWYCWPFAVYAGILALPFAFGLVVFVATWTGKLLWTALKAPFTWGVYRSAVEAFFEFLDRHAPKFR